MECGVPFCQRRCPLGATYPEWTTLVYTRQDSREGRSTAHRRTTSPKFTRTPRPRDVRSRLVLENRRGQSRVTIKQIELAVNRAWKKGLDRAEAPRARSGPNRSRSSVGTGRARVRATDGTKRSRGDGVRADEAGGGLGPPFGIPDSKIEKESFRATPRAARRGGHRRFDSASTSQRHRRGPPHELRESFDAVVLATGS